MNINELINKKISILGFGKEGKSTLSFLQKIGCTDLTVIDKNINDTIVISSEVERSAEETNSETGKNVEQNPHTPLYQGEIEKIPQLKFEGQQIKNIKFITGDNYLDNLEIFDYIFKSPGISPYKNDLLKYKDKLWSQTKLFFELYKGNIISVTQTKGKSTTVTLIYELLKDAGYKVKLVGNIGNPVLDEIDLIGSENDLKSKERIKNNECTLSPCVILGLDQGISIKEKQLEKTKDTDILESNNSNDTSKSSSELIDSGSSPEGQPSDNYDFIIYELSSYMLEDLDNHHSFISILGNIYEDHLDWHNGFENYKNSKLNILKNSKNLLIGENLSKEIFEKKFSNIRHSYEGRKLSYSFKTFGEKSSYYAHDKNIFSIDGKKLDLIINPKIPGEHNLANFCAILGVTDILKIEYKIFEHTINNFSGLPHRLQNLGIFNGITFIDDAISTTPESTIEAIKTFKIDLETIFLGGTDRGYTFDKLVEFIDESNIKNIVLFPQTGENILKSLKNKSKYNILQTKSMQEAVFFAYKNTTKGKICLLSTASPSYFLWKNYEEKGDLFKKFIKEYMN
ncbi:MAG: Mur ligase family protein [Candidatus Gracilibacteria bacterium]|nr:Mur ligase family protein [Candidatus Gracilibacteria bacterium]